MTAIPQYGTITNIERLTPSMVRLTFGGHGLEAFVPARAADQYLKADFIPEGAPYTVPFLPTDYESLSGELRPRSRRYTVRAWNQDTRELTVDFVAHGDVGYAGRWAQNAVVGDRLQFSGPSGSFEPSPSADWHLLIGDESALPAIAAIIEALPAAAVAVAIIVVDQKACEVPVVGGDGTEVHWLHRRDADDPSTVLVEAVRGLSFKPGTPELFVHGEAGEVRSIRKHLAVDRGIDISGASISPYWRRTYTDEDWRKVKREWLAEVAKDI